MTRIEITKGHSLSKENARFVVGILVRQVVRDEPDFEWRWESDTLRFSVSAGRAKGVNGEVTLTDDSVGVMIDLTSASWSVWVARWSIEHELKRQLEMLLPTPSR